MADIILTDEMKRAYDIIENTNDNIYITGKAGAGKTTFLKYATSHINKRFIVTAPTGVAAVNAHGVTLHSQFNIPFGFISPDIDPASKYNPNLEPILCNFDVLVMDECSMIRPDVLDYVDRTLRMYRKSCLPFGGVQVIIVGDLLQLAPVVKREEQEAMDYFYEGPYFFYSSVWAEKGFHVCEFSHIFRQSDDRFIGMLNRIREYKFTPEDGKILNEIYDPIKSCDYDNGYIHLCSRKDQVAEINNAMLGIPTMTYTGTLDGKFNPTSCPCDIELKLRVGARVMTLINDSDKKYYNGSIGTVVSLEKESVKVKLDNGLIVDIKPYKWAEIEYKLIDGEVKQHEKGTFTQIPLALAYAVTIHKSQGLTFDKVALHVNRTFSPGQLYVALSRCRTLEGIISDSIISKRHIIVDRHLIKFYDAVARTNYYFDKNTIKYIV